MATTSPVVRIRQMRTSPKAPRPMILSGSKSLTVIFLRILRFSSASLCRMSYFIRSFSVSVNLRCSILRSSMSHPTNKVQNSDKLTLFAFFLFVFQLRVFTFYICFSILSSFFGPFAQILWLLRLRPSLLFLRGLLCLLRILGVSGQFCP